MRNCVFSYDQLSKTASVTQLMAAHYSENFFRLSATYGPVVTVHDVNPDFVVPDGQVRFVESVIMELRCGGKEAVRVVELSRQMQLRVDLARILIH